MEHSEKEYSIKLLKLSEFGIGYVKIPKVTILPVNQPCLGTVLWIVVYPDVSNV